VGGQRTRQLFAVNLRAELPNAHSTPIHNRRDKTVFEHELRCTLEGKSLARLQPIRQILGKNTLEFNFHKCMIPLNPDCFHRLLSMGEQSSGLPGQDFKLGLARSFGVDFTPRNILKLDIRRQPFHHRIYVKAVVGINVPINELFDFSLLHDDPSTLNGGAMGGRLHPSA
jgi:hypothetical protein